MVEPGTQVGRYEVQRTLGRGGMGTVYVAHDPVLGRMVAIKMFVTDAGVPDAGARFSREARSAALLNHPNIVTVYDFGQFDSQPYIVMEYVAGEPLAHVIARRASVTIADRLRWMDELCAGAGYAHRMSVIHRDIKPTNLMIDKSGRLKILDFGIARMMGTPSSTAMALGTPGYMAPEQIRGEAIDPRVDVFSIGVVFYELVAFTQAFPGDSHAAIMHRVLTEEPVPLTQLVVDCHPEIAAVCSRALMKNRDDRFATADEMREAIKRLRGDLEADSGVTFLPATFDQAVSAPATPPPAADPSGAARRSEPQRRLDRQALARRRLELLEAALQEAREELKQARLESALLACQRALALDENHSGAIDLEQQIHTALDEAQGASAPGADTNAFTILNPTPTEAGAHPVPPHKPSGPQAPFDAATQPDERTMLRIPSPEDRTVMVSRETPISPATAARSDAAGPVTTPSRASVQPARAATWPDARAFVRTRRALLLAAGAVITVAAVVASVFLFGGPPPTGIVVIDAVPWARIVAIQTESGGSVPLPTVASTPLSLALPVGTYRITLTGPDPGAGTKQVEASVVAEGTILSLTQFQPLTAEEYFERHLGLPDASTVGTPASGESPAPAASISGGGR
jgi:serine/threonine protein kinase